MVTKGRLYLKDYFLAVMKKSRHKRLPLLAIVGRPNVGKSTLFNRLVGERRALVDDQPGVTRDRNYGRVEWSGRTWEVVDTGGFEPAAGDDILRAMRKQSEFAIAEADVVVLRFYGAGGFTPPGSFRPPHAGDV
jgi:GTP-binding protein